MDNKTEQMKGLISRIAGSFALERSERFDLQRECVELLESINKASTPPSKTDIAIWLKSKNYQTEQGDQEYKMYFDVDMPKIISEAIKEFSPLKK